MTNRIKGAVIRLYMRGWIRGTTTARLFLLVA
jgi:hypothetical protein